MTSLLFTIVFLAGDYLVFRSFASNARQPDPDPVGSVVYDEVVELRRQREPGSYDFVFVGSMHGALHVVVTDQMIRIYAPGSSRKLVRTLGANFTFSPTEMRFERHLVGLRLAGMEREEILLEDIAPQIAVSLHPL